MSTVSASLSSKASAVPRANIRTYYPKKSIKKPFDYFTDDVKEGLIEKFPDYTRHKISLMIVDKWKKLNETTKSYCMIKAKGTTNVETKTVQSSTAEKHRTNRIVEMIKPVFTTSQHSNRQLEETREY